MISNSDQGEEDCSDSFRTVSKKDLSRPSCGPMFNPLDLGLLAGVGLTDTHKKLSVSSQVRAYYNTSGIIDHYNRGLFSIHSNSWPCDKQQLDVLILNHGIQNPFKPTVSSPQARPTLWPAVKEPTGEKLDILQDIKHSESDDVSVLADSKGRAVFVCEGVMSIAGEDDQSGHSPSNQSISLGLRPEPRERKKWVKPIPMEHLVTRKELFTLSGGTFDQDLIGLEQPVLTKVSDSISFKSKADDPTEKNSMSLIPSSPSMPGRPTIRSTIEDKPKHGPITKEDVTENKITCVKDRSGNFDDEFKLGLDVSLDISGPRVPSPSSSITSNKRGLEWDSGADVGYLYHPTNNSKAQLSTIERLVLARGSAAFQLDAAALLEARNTLEPPQSSEGESSNSKNIQMKISKDAVLPRKDKVLDKVTLSQFTPIGSANVFTTPRENIDREKQIFRVSRNGNLRDPLAQSTPLDADQRELLKTTRKEEIPLSPVINTGSTKLGRPRKHSLSLTDINDALMQADELKCDLSRRKSDTIFSAIASEDPCFSHDKSILSYGNWVSIPKNKLVESTSESHHKFVQSSSLSPKKSVGIQVESISEGKGNKNSAAKPEKHPHVSVVDAKKFIENIQKNAAVHQQAINKIKKANTYPRTYRNEPFVERLGTTDTSEYLIADTKKDGIGGSQVASTESNTRPTKACSSNCTGAHKKGDLHCQYSRSTVEPSSCTSQIDEETRSQSTSSCDFHDTPRSVNATNDRGTIGSANSFEYLPGHIYENTNVKSIDRPTVPKKFEYWGVRSNTLARELEQGVKNFRNLINQEKDVGLDTKLKKRLIRQFVQKIVDTDYCEDYESSLTGTSVADFPDTSDDGESTNQKLPVTRNYRREKSHINRPIGLSSGSGYHHKHGDSHKLIEPSRGTKRRDVRDSGTSSRSCKYYIGLTNSTDTPDTLHSSTSSGTSRSNGVDKTRDWRQPITQSEKRLERSSDSKTCDTDTQSEELTQINKKIDHLNNLKMILERQDQLREYLMIEDRKLQPIRKQRNVYTVMTAHTNNSDSGDKRSTASPNIHECVNSVDVTSAESLEAERSSPFEGDQHLYTNWSSHVRPICSNTTHVATQIPSRDTINDQKKDQRNVTNNSANTIKQTYTQTPSSFDVMESSDTSLDHRTKQGRINVYVQARAVDPEIKRHDKYKDVDPLCCCQCEKKIQRLKEATKSMSLTKSTSTSTIVLDSCYCECHPLKPKHMPSENSQTRTSMQNLLKKSRPKPNEKNQPTFSQQNFEHAKNSTSTLLEICHNCNCPVGNDETRNYQPSQTLRNVKHDLSQTTKNVGTSTIENREAQAQTTSSMTGLPVDPILKGYSSKFQDEIMPKYTQQNSTSRKSSGPTKKDAATSTIETKESQTTKSLTALPADLTRKYKTSKLRERNSLNYCLCQTTQNNTSEKPSCTSKNVGTSTVEHKEVQTSNSESPMSSRRNSPQSRHSPTGRVVLKTASPIEVCSVVIEVETSESESESESESGSESSLDMCINCNCPRNERSTIRETGLAESCCCPSQRNVVNREVSSRLTTTGVTTCTEEPNKVQSSDSDSSVQYDICKNCNPPESCSCPSMRNRLRTRTNISPVEVCSVSIQVESSSSESELADDVCRTCRCHVPMNKTSHYQEKNTCDSCSCHASRGIIKKNMATETPKCVCESLLTHPQANTTSTSKENNHQKMCSCCARASAETKRPMSSQQTRVNSGPSRELPNEPHFNDQRCERCQKRNITICLCKAMKKNGVSDTSWDISSISLTSKIDCKKKALPKPVGYFLTFEETSTTSSSCSECVCAKRSLEEVRVKVPKSRLPPSRKQKEDLHKCSQMRKKHEAKPTPCCNVLSPISNDEQIQINVNNVCASTCRGSNNARMFREVVVKIPKEKQEKSKSTRATSRLTLQEYLRKNRPDYIQSADSRRKCLSELGRMRELRHESRQRFMALASQPGTLIDVGKLAASQSIPPPPMTVKRVFNQQAMRRQTNKNRQKCVEVINKKVEQKRKEDYRTNRLMAEIFTRKLQKNVLKGGPIDLSNSVSVITSLGL